MYGRLKCHLCNLLWLFDLNYHLKSLLTKIGPTLELMVIKFEWVKEGKYLLLFLMQVKYYTEILI